MSSTLRSALRCEESLGNQTKSTRYEIRRGIISESNKCPTRLWPSMPEPGPWHRPVWWRSRAALHSAHALDMLYHVLGATRNRHPSWRHDSPSNTAHPTFDVKLNPTKNLPAMSVVGSENDEDDEVLAFDVDRPFFPPPPAEDHSRRRATQENVIQRLQLEAQRRSAHYYLTEYLAIQTRLLSARAQVQGRSDEQLSNSRWIRKLVSDITTAPRGSRPGELTSNRSGDTCTRTCILTTWIDGVPEELANDVWALVVVRDQLVSDLTMLGHKLDEVSERFGRSATWSMVYPGTV